MLLKNELSQPRRDPHGLPGREMLGTRQESIAACLQQRGFKVYKALQLKVKLDVQIPSPKSLKAFVRSPIPNTTTLSKLCVDHFEKVYCSSIRCQGLQRGIGFLKGFGFMAKP